MIKDVMVRLDGTQGDDLRLAAVRLIAEIFDSHIIGLFFNILPPPPIQVELNGAGAKATQLPEAAKKAGDAIEAAVFERLTQLQRPTILRRFDVIGDEIADTALPLARAADTFVALRPNGRSNEPEGLIESLLFGTGRHLFLVPDELKAIAAPFDNVVVAWNGSRESARALAESLPYLHRAKKVGVLVVEGEHPTEADALKANEAVLHLRHHGIDAVKYRATGEDDEIAEVLIAECRRLDANLLVLGGYGHSRLHELLPGSTTDRILRRSPLPLLIAH